MPKQYDLNPFFLPIFQFSIYNTGKFAKKKRLQSVQICILMVAEMYFMQDDMHVNMSFYLNSFQFFSMLQLMICLL